MKSNTLTHPHYTHTFTEEDVETFYAPCAPIADSCELSDRSPRLMLHFPSRSAGAGNPKIFIAPQGEMHAGFVIGLCPPIV